MITALVLSLSIGRTPGMPPPPVVPRPRIFRSDGAERTNRLGADDLGFFEAFNGIGVTGPCSTTAPTGAKGEAFTFTRAGQATCTRTAAGGDATSGIASGDLVYMSNDQIRQEYDPSGVLGVRIEGAATNLAQQSDALTLAPWADVGTPGVADGATDPFNGTTGDTITDDDPANLEGRSQTITVSAGAVYSAFCYVRAGSLNAARITLDGTITNVTGLSASTWNIVEVVDASSSGVSIAVQVLAGSATTDTGTVIFGGCQVEAGSLRTSYIRTAGAAASRVGEVLTASVAAPGGTGMCMMATLTARSGGAANYRNFVRIRNGGTDSFALVDNNVTEDLFAEVDETQSRFVGVSPYGTSVRIKGYADGTTLTACVNATCQSVGQTSFLSNTAKTLHIGGYTAGANPAYGLISRIFIDPNPARCL